MKYLLGLLVAFGISDGLLSHFLIRGGLAREGNPLLMSLVGEPTFLILKVAGTLLCALILWDIHKRWPRVALISTAGFIMVYGVIVFWNLSLFFLA